MFFIVLYLLAQFLSLRPVLSKCQDMHHKRETEAIAIIILPTRMHFYISVSWSLFMVPKVLFDIFLLIFTCWNALDRPRHMGTAVIKQLYLDGAVYFVVRSPCTSPYPLRH